MDVPHNFENDSDSDDHWLIKQPERDYCVCYAKEHKRRLKSTLGGIVVWRREKHQEMLRIVATTIEHLRMLDFKDWEIFYSRPNDHESLEPDPYNLFHNCWKLMPIMQLKYHHVCGHFPDYRLREYAMKFDSYIMRNPLR